MDGNEKEREMERGEEEIEETDCESGRWGGLKNYSHSVFPLEVKPVISRPRLSSALLSLAGYENNDKRR